MAPAHRGRGMKDLWGGRNPRQGRGGIELGMMKVAVGRLEATTSFLVHYPIYGQITTVMDSFSGGKHLAKMLLIIAYIEHRV